MLVPRNYWPAVEKCSFALVPSVSVKEAGAPASSGAFTRGQELPPAPAVCATKGPARGRGHGLGLPPPSAEAKGTKRGLCLPSPQYQCQGQAGGSELSTVTPLPLSGPSQLCCVGSPSIWQGSFAPRLQIKPLTATIHGCNPLAFYIFGSLHSELLGHFIL